MVVPGQYQHITDNNEFTMKIIYKFDIGIKINYVESKWFPITTNMIRKPWVKMTRREQLGRTHTNVVGKTCNKYKLLIYYVVSD